jgi:hypothetical protein
MTLVEEQFKFLMDVEKLLKYIRERGWVVTGGELWRPIVTQRYYIEIGRSKTMNSMHLKRLAIDLNFFKPLSKEEYERIKEEAKGVVVVDGKPYRLTWKYEDIKPFGEFWESLDPKNRWGGNFKTFKDVPHFERFVKG